MLFPLVGNIFYDGVLRLPIARDVQIIGSADDIAVTIVAKEMRQIEATCVRTLARIKSGRICNQVDRKLKLF